jgi:hypothetical protein
VAVAAARARSLLLHHYIILPKTKSGFPSENQHCLGVGGGEGGEGVGWGGGGDGHGMEDELVMENLLGDLLSDPLAPVSVAGTPPLINVFSPPPF